MAGMTGDIVLTKLVNIDLNGMTLTGNVEINTDANGSLNITSGTITGNLTITAAKATVNNAATVNGLTKINGVSYDSFISTGTHSKGIIMAGKGRLVLSSNARTATVSVETTEEVRLAGDIAKVVVNTAGANVTVNTDGTVAEVEASQPVTLVNNGTVTEVSGASAVTLLGDGEVTTVTNKNITVDRDSEAYPSNSGLKEWGAVPGIHEDGKFKATFLWFSTNGIGTKLVEKSGRYNYFNDGVFLEITVKNGNDDVAFDTLFDDMTLQTDAEDGTDAPIDSIKGGATGRQYEDWTGVSTSYYTKLKPADSKAVYYGVRQSGKGTSEGDTRTVGFNPGESREINLTLIPKSDIEPGTYTITITLKQQTGPTTSKNVSLEGLSEQVKDVITYDIVISEPTPEPTALEKVLEAALEYKYDPEYDYKGIPTFDANDLRFQVSFDTSFL